MKRSAIAITTFVLMYSAAHAAPSPSAYDRLQDIAIQSNSDFNDYQQTRIVKNESDIRDLTNNTQRQFDQVNQYVQSVDQARADGDAALGQRIGALENAPKPKDGVDGKDGKDGINGKDGVDGKDGVNGVDGVNGRDGVDGAPGKDGAKGDTGPTGAAGNNGADGRNGTDGTNGKDADMAVVNAQINAATQHSNQQFASLKQQIDDNHKKANAGSASAMAAAGVPQVTGNQTFTLGAAVGGYESENAVAVGASYRASESVTLKATVAADTQQGFGYNAGIAIGW